MQILHTSAVEKGQIYLPQVNALLLCAVLVLVLLFRNSDNLAAAYGFAVTGTMLTTSVLAFAVLPRGTTGAKRMLWFVVLGLLLLFDVLLFSANVFKIHEGGWLPLVVAIVVFTLMMTGAAAVGCCPTCSNATASRSRNSWSSWRPIRRHGCRARRSS